MDKKRLKDLVCYPKREGGYLMSISICPRNGSFMFDRHHSITTGQRQASTNDKKEKYDYILENLSKNNIRVKGM